MNTATLENWRIVDVQFVGSTSRLIGDVYGHPNFSDGSTVKCSAVEKLTSDTAITQNTEYRLGEKLSDEQADECLFDDLLMICNHAGLAQDEIKARSIPEDRRCGDCDGTGNRLHGMYQACSACGGSGLAKEVSQ